MIKYRINGKFLKVNGTMQNICSDYFQDSENPFIARNNAVNYLNNFIDLLINDFKIDFEATFEKKTKLELGGEFIDIVFKYGIAIEFTIDDMDFYEIDYYGLFDNHFYDNIALGLEVEFNYYKDNNLYFENSKSLTYCNFGEWTEGHTEDEPTTFEILETSIDFRNKEEPFWWLSNNELKTLAKKVVERKLEDSQIEKAFEFGENNFIEFKPALLYNFKTKQASIGVKKIIAKVICSFLNSNGGKLLIGVNDSGNVQGLHYDFSLSNKENGFDFFRLEFENLLFQFFDKNVYNYIKSDFNSNYDKTIFEISIKPSDTPVFLLNKKENTKEFYIRTITSSLQINDIEEVVKYCLTHWKQKND